MAETCSTCVYYRQECFDSGYSRTYSHWCQIEPTPQLRAKVIDSSKAPVACQHHKRAAA